MKDFWHCAVCKGNYDHGEKCDCQKQKPVTYCFTCGAPLIPDDLKRNPDIAYEMGGHILCKDCVDKYVGKNGA